MNGRIEYYNDGKGFGFIRNENNEKYFFHISSVQNKPENIGIGYHVKFNQGKNEKGLLAKDIIVETSKNQQFIKVYDSRIKLTNIKNYGIHEEKKHKQKDIEYLKKNEIHPFDIIAQIKDYIDTESSYYDDITYKLYITTFQNDNFEWASDSKQEFQKIIKEIDEYFGTK